MHATTIAKVEAGKRSVRVNEAVIIAELYEVTVDALVGRHGPDDTTLLFALMTLSDYVDNVKSLIGNAQGYTTDVLDQLEDATQRFDEPVVHSIHQSALALDRALDTSYKHALRISASAMQAATETPPRSAPRSRPRKSSQ